MPSGEGATKGGAKSSFFRLSVRIPFLIVFAAVVAGLVTAVIAYYRAQDALHQSTQDRLMAVLEDRRESLSGYLSSIRADLATQSSSPFVQEALSTFAGAWVQLGDDPTTSLQQLYIDDNPHPIGERENLDAASDGSTYSDAHRHYHPWMRTFLRERDTTIFS